MGRGIVIEWTNRRNGRQYERKKIKGTKGIKERR
jgi:hypothetical protein